MQVYTYMCIRLFADDSATIITNAWRTQVVDFYVDTFNANVDFWASSMNPASDGEKANFHKTRLTAVNLATFLLTNFLPEDFVVIKMDIESAGAHPHPNTI